MSDPNPHRPRYRIRADSIRGWEVCDTRFTPPLPWRVVERFNSSHFDPGDYQRAQRDAQAAADRLNDQQDAADQEKAEL